ncbi:MAG: hypothetical protein U0V70_14330 [Terriglobia bacterium]
MAILALLLSLPWACSEPEKTPPLEKGPKIRFTAFQDGEIWIRHSEIQLRFDPDLYGKIFLNEKGKLISFQEIPPVDEKSYPNHFLDVDGEMLKNFRVDYANIGTSDIGTPYGIGRRLHLTGVARTKQGITFEKELKVDLYNDYQNLAMVSCEFRNTDKTRSVRISSLVDDFFRLDASRLHSGLRSFDFNFYQGLQSDPNHTCKLDERFAFSAPFALSRAAAGNFLPFFDFWNDSMGLAVGYLSSGVPGGMLTAKVTPDNHVEVGVHYPLPQMLGPGQSVSTPRSVWIVHSRDSSLALQQYQKLIEHHAETY